MKNRRWITLGMCGLMTWFFVMPAVAQSSGRTMAPKGATMEMQIERKVITRDSAEFYRLNNKKINLGVYVIFSKEWAPVMEGDDANVRFSNSNISWAFYDNEAFSQICNSTDGSHYLQNPSDYVTICTSEQHGVPPPAGYCTVPNKFPSDWCATEMNWHEFGWPMYSWGSGFSVGLVIDIDKDYAEKLPDGRYKVKIYDLQFTLNSSNTNYRDLPVGFVDDIVAGKLDGSNANCQINPIKGSNRYWPTSDGTTYESCPLTSTLCQDWTDFKGTKYFEFIPGGLFIETGPEVVTFEPYFGISSFSNRLTTNNLS